MNINVLRGQDVTLVASRRGFVASVFSGLSRQRSFAVVPKALGLKAFQFCTKREEKYIDWWVTLDPSLVASWARRNEIDDKKICFVKPPLRSSSRNFGTANSQCW